MSLNENENFQDDFNLENDEEFIQIQQELANLLEKLQNGESLEFLPGENPFDLINSLEPSDIDTIPLGYEFLINDEELKSRIIPMYNYESDSGFDLFNAGPHITIESLGRTLVPTGIKLNIPINCEIQIRPKSGLALKHGLTVLNTPATIDQGYTGEIQVILFNTTNQQVSIPTGMKIAQAVLCPVFQGKSVNLVERDVNEGERSDNGFGSTGI